MRKTTKKEKRNFIVKAYQIIGLLFFIAGGVSALTFAAQCDLNKAINIPLFIVSLILLSIAAFITYDHHKYCEEHKMNN